MLHKSHVPRENSLGHKMSIKTHSNNLAPALELMQTESRKFISLVLGLNLEKNT